MVAGIERLRKAKKLLADPDLRQGLFRAATEYWSAAIDAPSWPAELQRTAEALNRSLFLYGPIRDTITHMTDRELRRVHAELLDLVSSAERLCDDRQA